MAQEPHYTVFIRLPFPRNGFEDPAPAQWDVTKDQQLWKAISSASNSRELDWEELSEHFNAPLSFLLQQAAWLYERHFEGMKAQMKKLNVGAAASSSTPPIDAGRQRATSGASTLGIPPAISTQKSAWSSRRESGSQPNTPKMPIISRTPSTNTVTQSRMFGSTKLSSRRPPSSRGRTTGTNRTRRPSMDDEDPSALQDEPSSETDESEDEPKIARTNLPSTYRSARETQLGSVSSDADAEDDEADSSGGFLPFAASSKTAKADPAATIRSSPRKQNVAGQQTNTKSTDRSPPPSSSVSSASSAPPVPSSDSLAEPTNPQGRGALGPQQRAHLAHLSPRYRKSGSEGSPSMGSSFSDLDDASVTQSALGEALLSNMQHGSIGIGSRMSSLRDALGRRQ